MVKAAAKKKRSGEQRSNSTKVTALTMMKSNIPQADNDPFLTPHGLQLKIPGLMKVHKRTIRRVISKELGIPSRMAATKPHLTEAQRERRLDWAQRKRAWTLRRWSKILWTDETHIELWRHGLCGLRFRRSSSVSRYDPRFIRRSVKHPPKLMIWAAIGNGKVVSIHFVAPNEKMNAAMYKDVLRRNLTRSFKMTGCSVLMQDGAPCHTACSIKEWLSKKKVPVLDWVGHSAGYSEPDPVVNLFWDF